MAKTDFTERIQRGYAFCSSCSWSKEIYGGSHEDLKKLERSARTHTSRTAHHVRFQVALIKDFFPKGE